MEIKRKHLINIILFIIMCAVFITKQFFYDFYKVPQKGMYPTIQDSKRFLCKKYPYKSISDIQRGDVIAFKGLWKDGKEHTFIWRVIGLPGDIITIQNDQVIINGNHLKKEKISEEDDLEIYEEVNENAIYNVAYSKVPSPKNAENNEYIVPENHIFVLGDNRDNAHDSRYMGFIPFDSIFARKL